MLRCDWDMTLERQKFVEDLKISLFNILLKIANKYQPLIINQAIQGSVI